MSCSNRSTKKKSVPNITTKLKTKNLKITYLDLTGMVNKNENPYLYFNEHDGSFSASKTVEDIGIDSVEDVTFDNVYEVLEFITDEALFNPQLYRAIAELLEDNSKK